MATKTKIKIGDKVIVISGKDKGKEGKVLVIDRKKNKVIVEGINLITKHQKPNAKHQQGGLIKKESFINASNIMYLYNGKPTRLGYKLEKIKKDGKEIIVKKRIAKKTKEVID